MPSSSVSLTGVNPLSVDPLHTIEGDLSLMIRQLLTPQEQKLPLARQKQLVNERQTEMGKIKNLADTGEQAYRQQEKTLEQSQSNLTEAPVTNQFSFAKRKTFNLKKYAQLSTPADILPQETPVQDPSQESLSIPRFSDASDLREYLLQIGPDKSNQIFSGLVSNNFSDEQNTDDAISRFFETNDPQRSLELASDIFRMLPQAVKSSPDANEGDTQVTGIEQRVAESNEIIRQAAIQAVKNKNSITKKAFNMKMFKTAQHKGLENTIMFGPDQVRVDPFTGQLISNWHVYERNKGWGIKMPDALDVDFEAIWRGNIMDKYSRPYRNDSGEYVGGYLNKRFEVDRSIPEGNSYQLLPGQKRRAYLPEYRGYEARLQAMRSKPAKNGLEFANTDKPTDWSKEGTDFNTFNFKRDVTASKKKVS